MKYKKKILKLVCAIFLLCTCLIGFQTQAKAETYETPNYTTPVSSYEELESRLEALEAKYQNKYWTTTGNKEGVNGAKSKQYYGSQCNGFAKYIFNDLFCTGSIGSYADATNYCITNPNGAVLVNQALNYAKGDSETIKNVLSQANIGDFIQVRRRNTSNPHSMIVAGKTDNGLIIFDCNRNGNGCLVTVYGYDFKSISDETIGISLYHSTRYPAISEKSFDFYNQEDNITISGKYTFRWKQTGYGTCDVNLDIFGRGLGTIYPDENGYFSYELNTTEFENGTYTLGAIIRSTDGSEKYVTRSFTIDNDNEAPVISNVHVFNLTSGGYYISCVVTDNKAVQRVTFATWTEANDQDDIIVPEVQPEGNLYIYQVKTSDHNNETGPYVTHIYAYDSQGNVSDYRVGSIVLPKDYQIEGTNTTLAYLEEEDGIHIVSCNQLQKNVVGNLVIPEKINGKKVVAIDNDVFFECTGITSVSIPEGVTKIGGLAFRNCSNVRTVNLPGSLVYIGQYAFEGCGALTDVNYNGNQAAWNTISVEGNNDALLHANIHYNANSDKEPPAIDVESLKFSTEQAVAGDVVTISVKVTDNKEIDRVLISLENSDAKEYQNNRPMVYNAVSGCYEYNFEIKEDTKAGKWKVSNIQAYDTSSNKSIESGFTTMLQVTANQTYTVRYCANGSSEEDVLKEYKIANSEITVENNFFKRAGYTFVNWNTKKDGSGVSYNPGEKISKPEKNTTLYAQWQADLKNVVLGEFINTSNGVQVSWEAVENASAYRVYRRTENGKWGIIAKVMSGTSYLDNAAQNGVTYYYTVRAENGSSLSPSFDATKRIVCIKNLADVVIEGVNNGANGVTINWKSVSGAKAYRVYRRVDTGKWTVLTSNAVGTSYLDKTAQTGVTYYYTVRALNDKVISTSCDQKQNITCVKQLANVTLGAIQNNSQGVTVSWTAVSGAKSYRIYRRTVNGSWLVLTSAATGTSYLDKTAQAGITYYYTVRALNDKMISPSCDKTRSITCVKQLSDVVIGAIQNTSQGVTINWSAVSGAKTYRVYRRNINGNWTVLTSNVTGTVYTDKTAQNGVTYYYTVRALNDNVISASCDKKKYIVSVNKLDNVIMGNLSSTSLGVQVKWSKVNNAKSYRVYRRTEDGKWTIIADKVTGISYIDQSAESGTTYYYTVRAINDIVMSPSYDGSKKIKY